MTTRTRLPLRLSPGLEHGERLAGPLDGVLVVRFEQLGQRHHGAQLGDLARALGAAVGEVGQAERRVRAVLLGLQSPEVKVLMFFFILPTTQPVLAV